MASVTVLTLAQNLVFHTTLQTAADCTKVHFTKKKKFTDVWNELISQHSEAEMLFWCIWINKKKKSEEMSNNRILTSRSEESFS